MKTQETKLRLYYDGACHLCSREVEGYLRVDKNKKLVPVDISASDFDAESEGVDANLVNKYFHVKNHNGELIDGVEAFAAIWDELGILSPLSWFSKTMLGGFAMHLSYVVFAEIRPYLPKRKECESCKI